MHTTFWAREKQIEFVLNYSFTQKVKIQSNIFDTLLEVYICIILVFDLA